ncbi:MAG: hypothetical protein QOH88_666 [Verrucomicrobiota bacterium]|jgi:hypothetical protein
MLRIALLFLLLAASAHTRAEMNFTPTMKEYTSEGGQFRSLSFLDDKRTITIELPRQWNYRGDASRLELTPPGQTMAKGTIQAVTVPGPQPFDEAAVKALEARVMSELPPSSQGAAITYRQENPVLLEQNLSYEFVVSYQMLGKVFQTSVIFVSCPDKQLVFRFTAPQSNFAALNQAFRRSIISWQGTEPSTKTAAASAPKTGS